MEGRGLGKSLDITSFTPSELADDINIVINDETFKNNAKIYSAIMHN